MFFLASFRINLYFCSEYDAIIYVANWPSRRREVWQTLLKAGAREAKWADDVTAIDGVQTVSEADDDVWYSLSGQKVDNPSKGIFIHRGKKVVIK